MEEGTETVIDTTFAAGGMHRAVESGLVQTMMGKSAIVPYRGPGSDGERGGAVMITGADAAIRVTDSKIFSNIAADVEG